jgi:acyl-CoA reductase-like NAD-dependent aldehyde dehydrogenase
MRIAREEVFGPVLSIIPFDTEEQAFEIANDTPYGLAAGVWTSDIGRALRASERLQVGTIWVNTYRVGGPSTPFGGYKRSGLGREGGTEARFEPSVSRHADSNATCRKLNPLKISRASPGAASATSKSSATTPAW